MASRLDRLILSEEMNEGDKEATTQVLPYEGSDNWHVSLFWDAGGSPIRRPFRFEKLWLEQNYFKDLVGKWREEMEPIRGTLVYQFKQKLRKLKAKLRTWNKEEFRDIFQDKKLLKNQLEEIQHEGMDNGYMNDLRNREQILLDQLNARERQE